MLRHQGYTFRLRALTDTQVEMMRRQDGQARWVWNNFLALDLESRAAKRKILGFAAQCQILASVRQSETYGWLAEGSAPSQQTVLRHLQTAWSRFFKGEGQDSGFSWSGRQHCQLDQANSRIKLPKLGWVRYRNSRKVHGEVINATLRRSGAGWDMSIGTERDVPEPKRRSLNKRVGLDLGIAVHTATSEGQLRAGPNALEASVARLRLAQRRLARRQKGSQRRYKQVCKVARLHQRIGNVRKDHLHKLTTELAKNHGLVCVEDLKVSNMSRSAKGTLAQPGRNVRAKSGLNRRILDQGWGEMRRQLAYKLGWNGGMLKAVPAAYTSRRCSACQHVDKGSRISQSAFCCTACGHAQNADVNAAKNILAIGYAMATAAGSSAQNAQGGIGQRAPDELRTNPKIKGIPVL
jgi:putative transposase